MKPVCIGMIGSGYAAYLHGNGYEKVCGVPIRLKSICDIVESKAREVQARYGYEQACTDFEELLEDPEIDVIDIVTPPFLHVDIIKKALKAGKHVICEKPLTGYFGRPGDVAPIGKTVSKRVMYDTVMEQMAELREAINRSDKKFFYAENFVYATPVQRAVEIIQGKKNKILFMKGETSLKGSSSPVAGEWNRTGGGTLTRCGTHPLTGILYLKNVEAQARGEKITIKSVLADTGVATACLSEHEHRHIQARPNDVEDFGNVTITFSDGTKAVVISTDTVLGGTKDYIEVYCNDAVMMCNITPSDLMNTYLLDEDGVEDLALSEMLPSKLGWNKAAVSSEMIRGYMGELQDFMEAVVYDREPISGFELACQNQQVLYAAYLSSEEGRRIDF